MRALQNLAASWDLDYDAALSANATAGQRSPYGKVLKSLHGVRAFRFDGYQNDVLPNFIDKLTHWLGQFRDDEKAAAFLLAARFAFVTQSQFEALLRRLFTTNIRRHLIEGILRNAGIGAFRYAEGAATLAAEMDKTIFVPNSDSSNINTFVHLNGDYFVDREQRALVGPELTFWTYASTVAAGSTDQRVIRTARSFELRILKTDERLHNKTRLVVVEDFSGTGSDLRKSLVALHRSDLELEEVGIAVAIATAAAAKRLRALCAMLSSTGSRRYFFWAAHVLPEAMRCFDGPSPSYLDKGSPLPVLSESVKAISERLFTERFHASLDAEHRHGFGGLALAFAMFSNCPDNSLPLLWSTHGGWLALYPRVSRII